LVYQPLLKEGFAKPSFVLIQRYTKFLNPHLQPVNCGFKILKALSKYKILVMQSLLKITSLQNLIQSLY